jgi:hypothetical protein
LNPRGAAFNDNDFQGSMTASVCRIGKLPV